MKASYEADQERSRQRQKRKDDYIENEERQEDDLGRCDNPDWGAEARAR